MTNIFELEVMKIYFTKNEYRLLIDMLYVANWVMHSHDIGSERSHIAHYNLYQKLMSHYREMDANDIIEQAANEGAYCETEDYEIELIEKFLEPYSEETFWEELVDRLATRDLSNTIGFKRYQEMDVEEQAEVMTDVVNRYEKEFAEHGLDRIKIMDEDVVVSTS